MAKTDRSGGAGGFDSEQLNNARIIAQVGRQLGFSQRDVLIALMTAMQESTLRNLNYGDRDSVGLFQQRAPWGSFSERMDPYQSAKKFFLGAPGVSKGLKGVKNRNDIPLWQAAQRVQVSAFPRAYARHESQMSSLMAGLGLQGDIQAPTPEGPSPLEIQRPPQFFDPMGIDSGIQDPLGSAMDKLLDDGIGQNDKSNLQFGSEPLGIQAGDEPIDYSQYTAQDVLMPDIPSETMQALKDTYPGWENLGTGGLEGLRSGVINMAQQFVGKVPYVFGGEDPSGFDCSGLIQYVMNKMGVKMPRLGHQQAQKGQQTSISNITAGDLVYWRGQHIAIYLGNGRILEAPRPGLSVRVRNLGEWSADDDAIGIKLDY